MLRRHGAGDSPRACACSGVRRRHADQPADVTDRSRPAATRGIAVPPRSTWSRTCWRRRASGGTSRSRFEGPVRRDRAQASRSVGAGGGLGDVAANCATTSHSGRRTSWPGIAILARRLGADRRTVEDSGDSGQCHGPRILRARPERRRRAGARPMPWRHRLVWNRPRATSAPRTCRSAAPDGLLGGYAFASRSPWARFITAMRHSDEKLITAAPRSRTDSATTGASRGRWSTSLLGLGTQSPHPRRHHLHCCGVWSDAAARREAAQLSLSPPSPSAGAVASAGRRRGGLPPSRPSATAPLTPSSTSSMPPPKKM